MQCVHATFLESALHRAQLSVERMKAPQVREAVKKALKAVNAHVAPVVNRSRITIDTDAMLADFKHAGGSAAQTWCAIATTGALPRPLLTWIEQQLVDLV